MTRKGLRRQIEKNEKIIDAIESRHDINTNPQYSIKDIRARNHAQGIVNCDELKILNRELS